MVTDQSGTGVANAAVIFRLPDSGPSGAFADGTRSSIVYTDAQGKARTGPIHWGDTPGIVSLRITAAQAAAHAGLLFEETLSSTAPASPALATAIPAAAPVIATQVIATPVIATPVIATPGPRLAPGNLPAARRSPGVVIENVSAKSTAHKRARPVADPDDEETDPTEAAAALPKTAAIDYDSPDANVPIRHSSETGADEGDSPGISVTNAGGDVHSGHSKKKWLIALAAAAGAGVALAMLHRSSGSSTSGLSIGSPSISVGHP